MSEFTLIVETKNKSIGQLLSVNLVTLMWERTAYLKGYEFSWYVRKKSTM